MGDVLSAILHEYVEQEEEAAMRAGVGLDSCIVSSARYPKPPFFEHLTSLSISDPWEDRLLDDPRVLSYVLAHARQLKKLQLLQIKVDIDEAFTRRLIGAPLEKLDISNTEITDVTIDALCLHLAPTLRSLILHDCGCLTRQGLITLLNNCHYNDTNSHK